MAYFLDNAAFAIKTLPMGVYSALRRSLLMQGMQPDASVLTETDLPQGWSHPRSWTELVLLTTPTLQGLVVSQPLPHLPAGDCTVGVMTDPTALRAVITHLLEMPLEAAASQTVQRHQRWLQDRSADACSELLLTLLPTLVESSAAGVDGIATVGSSGDNALPPPVEQTAQSALDQQLEQSLLLNQVIRKIRESLDLKSILSTTVEEVRQCLEVDRLVIYQFQRSKSPVGTSSLGTRDAAVAQSEAMEGYVTYESLATPHVSSVKSFTEVNCFTNHAKNHERYANGRPIAIDDVRETYQQYPCLLEFLKKAQVCAKLISPILVQDRLWGFLIAHGCYTPRHWQPRELIFLQHIAEHLSIAVNQAELYEKLQEQTHSLESCVISRTQDLRDAMISAQTADLAKSEFLATMSHELRTPLTCIIGMSATLLRWSFGELSPRQRSYLTTIHDSGEQLLSLINDILEMAKIEAGRTALEIRIFSLASLAQKSLDPFRQPARDRNIVLSLDNALLADQDTFTGDPRRIQQMLDNLLSNALKFTDEGGEVNLRMRREQQTVVFQVEDSGIGIEESQIPFLFEKFRQLEVSRQRQYPGSGLGLALTKQLAELHGGSISVHSRVGVGSVFTIRLPLQRLQEAAAPPAIAEKPTPTKPVVGRIVLVEDREETASIICDLLTAADYQVIWVLEGSRVVEQVALLQPAVVIVNLHLNHIDGQRVIHALRVSLITAQVKILALDNQPRSQPNPEDIDATLPVPIEPEALLSTVGALVSAADSQ